MSYYITSYYIISCYIMSYYIISYYIMSYYIMLHYVILFHIILCQACWSRSSIGGIGFAIRTHVFLFRKGERVTPMTIQSTVHAGDYSWWCLFQIRNRIKITVKKTNNKKKKGDKKEISKKMIWNLFRHHHHHQEFQFVRKYRCAHYLS